MVTTEIPRGNAGSETNEEHASWIVRNIDRYGLRVLQLHAKDIHVQHKPGTEYIAGEGRELMHFRVGPLPFGTTKVSLSHAFRGWGWPARPGQPQGQSSDYTGMYWTTVAPEPPTHWIYQMAHGDVLITRTDQNREHPSAPASHVEASKRTLQHLTQQQAEPTDPWLKQDPWSKPQNSKGLSAHQLATLEANIHRKVVDSIASQSKTCSSTEEDTEMEAVNDKRIVDLEHQVRQLHDHMHQLNTNVQQTQQQQEQHNAQVAGQIQAVRNQVSMQESTMQKMLNQSMEDQYAKIEALFAKRAKQHE